MDLLLQNGAKVEYNDLFIKTVGIKREYMHFNGKKSVPLENLDQFDLAVILTDHSDYDYTKIVNESNLVVDTRNACAKINSPKIVKA